jgi:hypothetical protein
VAEEHVSLRDRVRVLIEDMSADPVEEIVIDYIARELRNGRKLADILQDPYVRNRLNEDRVAKMLEDPAISEAVDQAVRETFDQSRDILGS